MLLVLHLLNQTALPTPRLAESGPYYRCIWGVAGSLQLFLESSRRWIRPDKRGMKQVPLSFAQVVMGSAYSRQELAELWGYASIHAIARGVVTPRDDNKIVLFVTHEKQASAEQYEDELSGTELQWEGPRDHFAEDRILASRQTGDELHLFYRERHHMDFTYYGRLEVIECERHTDRPSRFRFRVLDSLRDGMTN